MNEALTVPVNGVCVLGMHRSGTSLVAGLLRELGVDLGPDEALLPADSNNESGYFELRELVHLNNDILAELGGSWDQPPDLSPGWEGSEQLAELRDSARELLIRQFAGSPLWGWKDPRTCLTLSLWQALAPDLRYVLCVRNPADVVRSLRERGEGAAQSPAEHGRNWLLHTASALRLTEGRPRMLVHYERFFDDSERELRGLARFIDREERLEDPGARERMAGFIDPALMHTRSAPSAVDDLPSEVAELYRSLVTLGL